MRILAATDFSPAGDEALRQADAWARGRGGELLACVVLPNRLRSRAIFALVDTRPRVVAELRARVAQVTGRAPGEFTAIVDEGVASVRLARQARQRAVDLIVVGGGGGHHHHGVAHRLLARAPCAVLVARPSERRGTVLFATDLSPRAAFGMRVAAEEARRRRARLVALHVHDLGNAVAEWMGTGFGRVDDDFAGDLRDELHHEIETHLEHGLARAGGGEARVVDGEPAEGILRVAGELRPELLVIGASGLTRIGRLFLGSVVDAVARTAPCPVLVVRPSAGWLLARRTVEAAAPEPRAT